MLNLQAQVDENAIYAINHSCRYDIPYAAEAIKRHTYVLVGRQRLNMIERIAFFLNGVIYVDRKDRSNKAIARETKRPIIPLILEYEKEDCYIKCGEPLYVTETDTKQKKIEQLSDEMASLRWDIWEMFPSLLRKELDGTEWEKEKCRRLAECPK